LSDTTPRSIPLVFVDTNVLYPVCLGGFGSHLHGADRQTYDIDFVPSTAKGREDRHPVRLADLALSSDGYRFGTDGLP
jgi:hypothetical protein